MKKPPIKDTFLKGLEAILLGNIFTFIVVFFTFGNLRNLLPFFHDKITGCIPAHVGIHRPIAESILLIQWSFGSISWVQLFYGLPYLWLARKNQHQEIIKGAITAIIITVLLAGNCFLSAWNCHSYSK